MLRKQKKEREPGARRTHIFQALLWCTMIVAQVCLLHCLETRAEEAARAGEATRPVETARLEETAQSVEKVRQSRETELAAEEKSRTEVENLEIVSQMYRSRDACETPADTYTDEQGVSYELEQWEAVPVLLPAENQVVEQERIFEQIEGMTDIPETVEWKAEHTEDRRRGKAVCTAESVEILREWWSGDFSFPVQFHCYDAEYYQLGGELIPSDEVRPQLDGYEELLLEIAGVPAEGYRVTDIRWDGEAYLDEAGILCRNAVASGEKLLRDYQVRYRGTVEFPETRRWQTVALYGLPEPEEPEAKEAEEAYALTEVTEDRSEQPEAAEPAQQTPFWKQVIKVITLSVSMLLPFLLLLLFLMVKRRKTWYTEEKKTQEKEADRRK
ncbi:MAG: hypothetical protein Q4F28_10190 [Eubacteriales bacterium]|nr:hypothetical protein [Eubacteriales bacterium]